MECGVYTSRSTEYRSMEYGVQHLSSEYTGYGVWSIAAGVTLARGSDPDQHPVWNYLYQERKALLIPLLPTLSMTSYLTHLGHDLPYHKSTRNTKLKEPIVIITEKAIAKWEHWPYTSERRWPYTNEKKPIMNLREYLHKFDIMERSLR